MTFAIYTHPDCLLHEPGPAHPESPARLSAVLTALRQSPRRVRLVWPAVTAAGEDEVLLAHSRAHWERLCRAAPQQGRVALDADTQLSPGSLRAALLALGAACQGVDDLLAGRCTAGFCATRPPGHHATAERAMGFCLLNHCAIAALHARRRGLARVAVLDFDVHHGNGSQDILADREGILYLSTHQSPLYPGTGLEEEAVAGNIRNLCLPAGCDGSAYRRRFLAEVLPLLQDFAPQLLLVSAGFDAHARDPLAGLCLEEADYRWLGVTLRGLAGGRVLAMLEGGYNLEVLGPSVLAFIEGLMDGG